jgi:hypothetical protein
MKRAPSTDNLVDATMCNWRQTQRFFAYEYKRLLAHRTLVRFFCSHGTRAVMQQYLAQRTPMHMLLTMTEEDTRMKMRNHQCIIATRRVAIRLMTVMSKSPVSLEQRVKSQDQIRYLSCWISSAHKVLCPDVSKQETQEMRMSAMRFLVLVEQVCRTPNHQRILDTCYGMQRMVQDFKLWSPPCAFHLQRKITELERRTYEDVLRERTILRIPLDTTDSYQTLEMLREQLSDTTGVGRIQSCNAIKIRRASMQAASELRNHFSLIPPGARLLVHDVLVSAAPRPDLQVDLYNQIRAHGVEYEVSCFNTDMKRKRLSLQQTAMWVSHSLRYCHQSVANLNIETKTDWYCEALVGLVCKDDDTIPETLMLDARQIRALGVAFHVLVKQLRTDDETTLSSAQRLQPQLVQMMQGVGKDCPDMLQLLPLCEELQMIGKHNLKVHGTIYQDLSELQLQATSIADDGGFLKV